MTSGSREHAEVIALAERVCAGTAADADRDRLAELIRADPDARRVYLRYMHLHVCLRDALGTVGVEPSAVPDRVEPARPAGGSTARFGRRRLFMVATGLAACLLVGTGLLLWPRPAVAAGVATLTRAGECTWDGGTGPAAGDRLPASRWRLLTGVAEVTADSGAVLLLEAPADLELRGETAAVLRHGRVCVRVPPQAIGYTVETPEGRVIDLGTEFGVEVAPTGQTLLQVFEGAVETSARRVTAGQAVRLVSHPGEPPVAFVASRFLRRFPDHPGQGRHVPLEWLIPYNRTFQTELNVTRPPGPVAVDAETGEWDRAAWFQNACAEPFAQTYHVRGAMMYDDQNLYVAAEVADPAPLRSVIDPDAQPGDGWRGGSLQLRLSTDPALGWPLTGASPWASGHPFRPEDRDPNLVHVTMWYCRPRALPCLTLEHGLDVHGRRANPPGFAGAYRAWPDGRGYTLEYAIPWTLLHDRGRAARPGDVLACCWQVNWANEGGDRWQGTLVDILSQRAIDSSPSEKVNTFGRAYAWGRAVYRPAGFQP